MKKQILRVKQLADQTLLGADKSDVLTEDLIVAEKRVDSIKQTCASTHKRILSCLHNVSLEDNEKQQKKVPELALFHSLQECHKNVGSQTLLGQVLADCANLQMRLGQELLGYERETDRQVLQPTNQLLETDLPNISKLRRQLSKLTLDMDAAKNRYQTALKHVQQSGNLATTGACSAGGTSSTGGGAASTSSSIKADGLREEAEDATSKVEQCRDALAAEMFGLISREPEFAHLLVQWYQLQADHHRRALAQIDAALPGLWGLIGNSPQKPVFGFPLEEHLRVNGRRIALVVEKCAVCLLASGMDEEGLFRITGSASKIKKLKSAFNAGFVDMSEFERDPHTVASVLKLYLRELPEPLMTFSLYEEWMKAASVSDSSARLQALWQVVNSLPQANHDNLRYVVKFLSRLVGHREQNKMSSQNIAIVIAPNLVWPKEENQSQHMGVNMGIANMHSSIVDTLVNYADWFFPGEEDFSPSPTRLTALPDGNPATHPAAPTTNGEVEGHLAGPSQGLTSQSPRIPHRPGKKAAPAAPLAPQPRDRTSIVIGAGSLPFDHRPGAPPTVGGGTLGRPRPMVKPQVAEKPTLQRRSMEGVVEGAAVAGVSYSTQSLERRPGRHQGTGAVGGRPQPCERPSVPPPERPKSGSLESAGRNNHHAAEASAAVDAQRQAGSSRGDAADSGHSNDVIGRQQQACYLNGRGDVKNHITDKVLAMSADGSMFAARSTTNGNDSSSSSSSEGTKRKDGIGRRDSGERPLSLEHQEMLSFADESDSEDGSSILVSPSGGSNGGSSNNGLSVMWKSCSASLPGSELVNGAVVLRRSPSRTNGTTPERPQPFPPTMTTAVAAASGDPPASVRQMDDARWNFLTASEQQPVPERPPRSSPSADTSAFAPVSEPKPSRQSPVLDAIHTTGPPPDLITSSERPKSDPASPTKSKLECGAPSPVPVLPEATRL